MRVTVLDGKAVNSGGRQYREGENLDVSDSREAARWVERHLVMPARPEPAKKAPTAKASKPKTA